MSDSSASDKTPRDYVVAKNRREAMKRLLHIYPTLGGLYRAGSNDDGKAGWINAIRDQHDPAYRLLFYLDRLPIAEEYSNTDLHELFFGPYDEHGEPNFQRVLFTTTGAINLLCQDLPDQSFAAALATGSLEVVPVSMERDLRTSHLLEEDLAYICAVDSEREGMWILSLKDFHEIYVSKDKCEVQVRDEERIFVGDTSILRPFFLRYGIKRIVNRSVNPSEAAGKLLED